MRFQHRWACTALLIVAVGASSVANAALFSRLGGQAMYDTDLNVTWLADANANGLMDWAQANAWAAGLTVDGISGWRLPTSDTCTGYCTSSELGHLFYNELGGVALQSITTTHNNRYNLFQNVQANFYWSGLEYAPDTGYAWFFDFRSGNQDAYNKDFSYYALAVHPGDVATVPLPATAWLFGSGMLGLLGIAKRRKR